MKLFVKRNQFKTFEKAKIEISKSMEWTLIKLGLQNLLKETSENIQFFEMLQSEKNEDYSSQIRYWSDRKSKLEEMIAVLNHENERVWK